MMTSSNKGKLKRTFTVPTHTRIDGIFSLKATAKRHFRSGGPPADPRY